MPATVPNGIEVRFDPNEILVSKTDTRGVIQYANQPFVEISGFTEKELLGAPHSIVRHPDMPRAVFHLLWDRIAAGHEVFAFVKNLCKDGRHYWVLAHVTPDIDSKNGTTIGYHSSRRQASAAAISAIEGVYDKLLRAESAAGGRRQAVDAGTGELLAILHELGVDYDEFIASLHTSPARAKRAA